MLLDAQNARWGIEIEAAIASDAENFITSEQLDHRTTSYFVALNNDAVRYIWYMTARQRVNNEKLTLVDSVL